MNIGSVTSWCCIENTISTSNSSYCSKKKKKSLNSVFSFYPYLGWACWLFYSDKEDSDTTAGLREPKPFPSTRELTVTLQYQINGWHVYGKFMCRDRGAHFPLLGSSCSQTHARISHPCHPHYIRGNKLPYSPIFEFKVNVSVTRLTLHQMD